MKRILSFILMVVAMVTAQAQQNAKIYVDMGTRGHDVSKSMYGMFFEEINHAGDGGLYAEMLQNRGFEEHVYPSGMTYDSTTGRCYAPHSKNYWGLDYADSWVAWDTETLKTKGWRFTSSGLTNTCTVMTPNEPLHENTPNALHIVMSQKTSQTGMLNVINDGYWGMATKKGATYKLRFYLRTADYQGQVKAMLCNKQNGSVGESDITIKADGQWNEYTATLTATQTVSNGHFCLQFSATGTVDLDYVSLFPTDTYKGRENGLRRDIAEMLEAMNPGFLRWPGGCIVEGITLENRVKWKETLGDPLTRRGEFSLWGYRSTYGLGMHEFLQLCEDMGMDGMFVGNVGMACSIRNGDFVDPTDEKALLPFRQDIEDAIEYAIGDPATNEWAAKRAAAGHPEPFPLKYVELGNENGSDRYVKRYAFFYDYLKKKYPQITFINTMSWTDASLFKKTDMYDVHWYVTPDEFYNQATLFDTAPRGNYTIYAGEYAVNNEVGHGNMDAALAEAVFIGGMERNSDFVTMASYAPLLTNVNLQNWHCNLIWFDTDRVMGRASYYVQTLFSQNRPDYNVKTRLYSSGQNLYSRGRIALGTWNTQAEFRNVKVTSNDGSKTFYESDFENNTDEWTEDGGSWTVTSDGTYKQSANGTPCVSVLNAYDFCNSTIELEARKTGGAEGFLVYLGASNENTKNGWRVNIGGWSNTKVQFEHVVNGGGTPMGTSKSLSLKNNQWYKIKIVAEEGKSMKCYVDGQLVAEVQLGDIFNGRLQAFGGYDAEAGEIVVKVVNGTEQAMVADICLNGQNIAATGRVITLASASLTEENSLDNPKKIYPEESTFDGFAETFAYTFKPCSFTIFRIKADGSAPTALEIPAYEWDDTPVALGETERLRAEALQTLSSLITRAEALNVNGAVGASALNEAINTARTAQTDGATIKQLKAIIATLDTAISQYIAGLMDAANEQTSKLKNPNFKTMNNEGWTGSKPALEHNVGEFFNCTFDTYQTLTGLQNGAYLLYVQGFYRNGGQPEAYAAHNNGTEALNALLYGNSRAQPIRSLYDFETGAGYNGQFCDNRAQAEAAFNTSGDTYANYLVVEVTNGRLRLGLKKTKSVAADWTCFNNFRLFYVPVESTGIQDTPNFESPRASKYVYTIDGRKLTNGIGRLTRGIYIAGGRKVVGGQQQR